jgi:hypothetical protein
MAGSAQQQQPRKRQTISSSFVSEFRRRHQLSAERVAEECGLSTRRFSVVERYPERAREGEIANILQAIRALTDGGPDA